MMAIKHNIISANTKNAIKAAALAPLAMGCVHKVLAAAWHLALRGLAKVDGYVCQEEVQDGDRQTPCPGKVKGGEICTYLL